MNKKVALITDTHFGLRNNSPYFLKKQKQFFEEVFFPKIDEEQIDAIIHLGDVYDKRSNVNFVTHDAAMSFFHSAVNDRRIDTHIIIGNHDCPFRNTNFPNAPSLLMNTDNYHVYADPTEVIIKGNRLLFIPWVNVENNVKTQEMIDQSNSRYLFGHLEIIGFQMLKGHRNEKGFDRKSLSKFDKVFSGHFHHRSTEDNVWYLGNPYETTWADFENTKGFHILDFEDHSLRMIENPFTSHVMVTKLDEVTEENLADKIVKVDLTSMTDDEVETVYKRVEGFTKRPENILYINKANFTEFADADTQDLAIVTTKDIMTEYIKSMETDEKKYDELITYMTELYDRAIEVS